MDQFSKLVTFVPCVTSSTAGDITFLNHTVRKFGMLKKTISDYDRRFTLQFGTTLMAKLGTKIGLSSSYCP